MRAHRMGPQWQENVLRGKRHLTPKESAEHWGREQVTFKAQRGHGESEDSQGLF